MSVTQHALNAALRSPPTARASGNSRARLLIAGAGGALGTEVLHRLAASGLFEHTDVLVTEPITMALPRVGAHLLPAEPLPDWPKMLTLVDTAVVMFEPPRSYNDRERAFFTPRPDQLPALAQWLQRCGVRTLVVVLPHAPGRLPNALKHGLANLDEQSVAALGFERVLLVRSAALAPQAEHAHVLASLAHWMLSITKYMIPAAEQPVQASRVAEFIEAALRQLPPGTHVAASHVLQRASRGGRHHGGAVVTMTEVVDEWLASKSEAAASPAAASV